MQAALFIAHQQWASTAPPSQPLFHQQYKVRLQVRYLVFRERSQLKRAHILQAMVAAWEQRLGKSY
jgi:hypothetical protein